MVEFLRDRDLARRVFEKNKCFSGPVHSLVSQAMDRGLIRRDDPRYAAERLMAMIKGFFLFPILLLGDPAQMERPPALVIADCVDMFLSQYALD
jgi:TetR/AcrR family transcriptional regulator of autoinduction and epiphytic fitness